MPNPASPAAGPIPQNSPLAAYRAQQAGLDAAWSRVLARGWYILGSEVEAFEREWAGYLDVPHAVGVASGTDALELSLRVLDIGPGDAVLTVAHTAVATVAAIVRSGATPVLVDIDPASGTMDPQALAGCLERPGGCGPHAPRAIIVVHLYGQPAAVPALLEIARRHGLALIEDCAQAHGAELAGRRVGTLGDLGAFSFYPTKNLGAFGDAGCVVTAHAAWAERLRALRQYGWRERAISDEPGINSRLDELQAALLRVRLERLDADNARRRALADRYTAGLAGTQLVLPSPVPGTTHVYHQYVIRTPARDALREILSAQGIGTALHYPCPVHLQPAYRERALRGGDLAHSEAAAGEVLSLPMFPQLTDAEADRVVAAIRAWGGGSHRP